MRSTTLTRLILAPIGLASILALALGCTTPGTTADAAEAEAGDAAAHQGHDAAPDADTTPPAADGGGTLDEADLQAQRDAYPLEVCVVSGEPLDAHGGHEEVVIDGRLVKICCAGCESQLREDPARFLKALDEGRAAASDGDHDHGHHDH